ncbi:uncharacterized protein [Cherax quadricarinatus]|uniref:uncharacterized protein n=1 Tax=Cherax quadricarinatus TaxID=27406 RepID=UPI00387ECE86
MAENEEINVEDKHMEYRVKKASLQARKVHITKAYTKCLELMNQETVNTDDLKLYLDALGNRYDSYKLYYNKYEGDLLVNCVDKTEVDQYYELEEKILSCKSQALNKLKCVNQAVGESAPTNNMSLPKLPELCLPVFNPGKNWEEFWSIFKAAVHDRSDTACVTKLFYLKGQVRGDAHILIQAFPNVNDSYKEAVDLLKVTYGNIEQSRLDLVNIIVNLKSPDHTYKGLQQFRVKLESTLKTLSNKYNLKESDWLLSAMVQNKLSCKTLEWLSNKYHKGYFGLEEIRLGLQELIVHLQTSQLTHFKDATHNNSEVSVKFHKGKNYPCVNQNSFPKKSCIGAYQAAGIRNNDSPQGKKNKYPPKSSPVNKKPVKERRDCLFCKGTHVSKNCNAYNTWNDKVERLEELDRCIRCLANHNVKDCYAKLNFCYQCHKGRHHIVMCKGLYDNVDNLDTTIANVKIAADVNNDGFTEVALPVLQVKIDDRHKSKNVTALLDQGSQRTFIKRKCLDGMKVQMGDPTTLKLSGFLSDKRAQLYDTVYVTVRLGNEKKCVNAVIVDRLPEKISTVGLSKATERLSHNVNLAQSGVSDDSVGPINILIGSDYYASFVKGMVKKCGVTLLKTAGGHVMYGRIPRNNNS